MAYDYQREKQTIFTDDGQKIFLEFYEQAVELLKNSGAFKMYHAFQTGDVWTQMACADRLVELGKIKEVTGPNVAGQDRVFVKAA